MSAHAALRAATLPDHQSVDAAFGGFDLSKAADYGRFLLAHARALPAVEEALAGVAELPHLRPRAPLLYADLAALDLAPPAPLAFTPPDSVAAAFGAAYVIEGSRLGGAMLARRVPAPMPTAYLGATHASGEWRRFRRALDAAIITPAAQEAAVEAARRVFALYLAAA